MYLGNNSILFSSFGILLVKNISAADFEIGRAKAEYDICQKIRLIRIITGEFRIEVFCAGID